jgi:hypothetical protein
MTIELKDKNTDKYVQQDESQVEHLLGEIKEACVSDQVCKNICGVAQPKDEEIRRLLTAWIRAKREGGEFPEGKSTGKYDEKRKYANTVQLARAVVGTLVARERWKKEFIVASGALQSDKISLYLNSVLSKLLAKIKSLDSASEILEELAEISKGPSHGTYESHFKLEGRLDVLKNPAGYPVQRKIAALHDMMEYLQNPVHHIKETKGTGLVSPPKPMAYGTSVLTSEDLSSGKVGVLRIEDKSRGKIKGIDGLWTREEENSGTVSSRVTQTPIWAGQSMTTARMLDTAVWAGAGVNELTAVAYAIFAFWRIVYDKSISPVHTYHEVMDVAKNYGVHYVEFSPPTWPAFRSKL